MSTRRRRHRVRLLRRAGDRRGDPARPQAAAARAAVEAASGPRRPPLQTPTGLIPLARLVGLIAIAIAIIVGLVFWVGACQGKSKHDDYATYATKVKAIAESSHQLGAGVREQAQRAGAEAGRPRDEPAEVRAAGAAGVRPGAADPRARAAARASTSISSTRSSCGRRASPALGDALSQTASTKDVDGRRCAAHDAGAAPHRERRRLGRSSTGCRRASS